MESRKETEERAKMSEQEGLGKKGERKGQDNRLSLDERKKEDMGNRY